MVKLIGLTGPKGCGKSEVAYNLHLELYNNGRMPSLMSFARPIKEMMRALIGDSYDKEEPSDLLCGKTPRYALQTLGTEWGRMLIGEDVWVNKAMRLANSELKYSDVVIFDDIRFDNEAQAIRDAGGVVFQIDRESCYGDLDCHSSEDGIDLELVDCIVDNSGAIEETVDAILNLVK
jgi:hypothetical protein